MKPLIIIEILAVFVILFLRIYYFQKFNNNLLRVGNTVAVSGLLWETPKEKYGNLYFKLSNYDIVLNTRHLKASQFAVGNTLKLEGLVIGGKYGNVINAKKITLVRKTAFGSFISNLSQIKVAIVSRVQKKIAEPFAGLALGLTLGVKEAILPDIYNTLVKTGTIHVAVVSGFNINLLIKALSPLINFIKKKWIKISLITVLVAIYCLLVLPSPPVIRAFIMGILTYLVSLQGRLVAGLRVLILAGFFMVIINPYVIYDISFQLSFGASLGLIVLEPKLKKILPINLKGLEEFFYTTISCQIILLPIISYYFGTISILSLVSNTLTLWVIPYATIFSFIYIFTSTIPVISSLTSFIVYIILNYFVSVNSFIAGISFSQINLRFSLMGIVVYYFGVLGVLGMLGRVGVLKKETI